MRTRQPVSSTRYSNYLKLAPAWLGILLVLAACGSFPDFPFGQAKPPATVYRAPTAAVPLTPLVAIPPTQAVTQEESNFPTATPACDNDLSYLADLTIPDGTVVSAGDTIDKRWQVKNSGTCNWDQRYHLQLTAGSDMGALAEQSLYPARSGIEFSLRLLMTAPQEPGTYRSAWQAFDPQGQPFGDPVFIEVIVPATQTP